MKGRACTIAVAVLVLAACSGSDEGPAQAVSATPEQLVQGAYIAAAADCAACHTAEGGAPFAGGVVLETPFGTIHGTNITPDADTGIGRWSADDFFRALIAGRARDGRHLYPAMPYTSYRRIERADADALYGYLMTRPAVRQVNLPNDLDFPYNLRFALRGWNALYLDDALPSASRGQSESWQRGRYLVDVLGHCGECHTPRGSLGQMDDEHPLAGAALARIAAPDITSEGLVARGWTQELLVDFLHDGIAANAAADGEMFPVIHLGTQHLDTADVVAMSGYLLGDAPPAAVALPAITADTMELQAGRQTYANLCAGCHGRDGEGKPHVAIAMIGNSTLRDADPHNLIVNVLDGLPTQDFPGLERRQDMPGFARELDDGEVAGLANYLRATWGGQPADVDAQVVRGLR